MKKRERRRYLTEKYRQRQIRLAYSMCYVKPPDTQRRLRRPLAKKQRFLDELTGCSAVRLDYSEHERNRLINAMLKYPTELSPLKLGRMRRHSWRMCSIVRCPSCSNPRRGRLAGPAEERLTMKERINAYKFNEDLALFHHGEYNDLLSH